LVNFATCFGQEYCATGIGPAPPEEFTMRTRVARPLFVVGLATLGLVAATVTVSIATGLPVHWTGASDAMGRPPEWLLVALIIFFAAIVSSIVGFASSAISGALIFHYVTNSVEAVQIMMIASIGIQGYSVTELSRSIDWRRCVPFVAGGAAMMPVGIALLLNLPSRTYILWMGAGLIVYGSFMLLRRPMHARSGLRPIADAIAGGLGGITGPLAAFPGAFVTIWCGMRGWTKVEQRSVYQPYILLMQVFGVGALTLLQPLSTFNPALLAYALPGMAGAFFGLRVFHALADLQFQRMINIALVVSGSALLLK
jgi:uncharacterized protein